MDKNKIWLDLIIELQSLAQAGLTYGKDIYDKERYERIREISAEMMSNIADVPLEKVKGLFCNEVGYQTPKIDTRAAIFKDNKILLVHENNGKWSLPGGWCDVNISVSVLKLQVLTISQKMIFLNLPQKRVMKNRLKCALKHIIQETNGRPFLTSTLILAILETSQSCG